MNKVCEALAAHSQVEASQIGVAVDAATGDEVCACVIESESDDYRYVSGDVAAQIRPRFLPEDVDVRCRALARTLELPVAGIDLRRSPDGAWYCFEVNPGFSYFQKATARPMGQAIARLLLLTAQ